MMIGFFAKNYAQEKHTMKISGFTLKKLRLKKYIKMLF